MVVVETRDVQPYLFLCYRFTMRVANIAVTIIATSLLFYKYSVSVLS